MTELSVIIPAYNAARWIGEAVASVAAQRMAGLQVVIVNDASTDSTSEVCRNLKYRYSKQLAILYDENRTNLGPSATRNRAIRMSSGEFVFMLDADNILPAGLLPRLLDKSRVALRDQSPAVMIAPERIQFFRDIRIPWIGDILPIPPFRIRLRRGSWVFSNFSYESVLTTPRNPGASGNLLFPRSVFNATGGYFEDVRTLDTWSFGIRCYVAGFRFDTVPGTWYLHRLCGNSNFSSAARAGKTRANLYRALLHLPGIYTEDCVRTIDPANTDGVPPGINGIDLLSLRAPGRP